MGLKPGEWEHLTPAEVWAYAAGWAWRRSQDLQALAGAVRALPVLVAKALFGGPGKTIDIGDVANVMRAGARADKASARANKGVRRALEEGVLADLYHDSPEEEEE